MGRGVDEAPAEVLNAAWEIGAIAGEQRWLDGEPRMDRVMAEVQERPIESQFDRGLRDALTWFVAGGAVAARIAARCADAVAQEADEGRAGDGSAGAGDREGPSAVPVEPPEPAPRLEFQLISCQRSPHRNKTEYGPRESMQRVRVLRFTRPDSVQPG